jgi:hypothetical protein
MIPSIVNTRRPYQNGENEHARRMLRRDFSCFGITHDQALHARNATRPGLRRTHGVHCVSIRALGPPLTVRSAAMDFAPVWSPRLLRTESAGRRREAKLTDKQHLEAMLTALDASLRALERIGDWQIVGNNGHIMTDGRGFVFYVSTSESPRRWTGIKKRIGFCRLTQDGDDEGCLYLERSPKADEAVLIREAIGIRKRRHLTPEALVALERARAAIKTLPPLPESKAA